MLEPKKKFSWKKTLLIATLFVTLAIAGSAAFIGYRLSQTEEVTPEESKAAETTTPTTSTTTSATATTEATTTAVTSSDQLSCTGITVKEHTATNGSISVDSGDELEIVLTGAIDGGGDPSHVRLYTALADQDTAYYATAANLYTPQTDTTDTVNYTGSPQGSPLTTTISLSQLRSRTRGAINGDILLMGWIGEGSIWCSANPAETTNSCSGATNCQVVLRSPPSATSLQVVGKTASSGTVSVGANESITIRAQGTDPDGTPPAVRVYAGVAGQTSGYYGEVENNQAANIVHIDDDVAPQNLPNATITRSDGQVDITTTLTELRQNTPGASSTDNILLMTWVSDAGVGGFCSSNPAVVSGGKAGYQGPCGDKDNGGAGDGVPDRCGSCGTSQQLVLGTSTTTTDTTTTTTTTTTGTTTGTTGTSGGSGLPGTGLFDDTLNKIVLGIVLLFTGIVAYKFKIGGELAENVLGRVLARPVQISKQVSAVVQKIAYEFSRKGMFESDILEKADKDIPPSDELK